MTHLDVTLSDNLVSQPHWVPAYLLVGGKQPRWSVPTLFWRVVLNRLPMDGNNIYGPKITTNDHFFAMAALRIGAMVQHECASPFCHQLLNACTRFLATTPEAPCANLPFISEWTLLNAISFPWNGIIVNPSIPTSLWFPNGTGFDGIDQRSGQLGLQQEYDSFCLFACSQTECVVRCTESSHCRLGRLEIGLEPCHNS